MKQKRQKNYAFIDGQNLNLGIIDQGWKLDLKKFRIYLKDKFDVKTAYYFIGYIEGNNVLYKSLQEYGYLVIFKPTLRGEDGKVKGNCDAELVLQAMIDFDQYNKAIIVTGDGDFGCLVNYLIERNKLEKIIAPDYKKCSWLLRQAAKNKYIMFLNGLRHKLEYKKKVP